MFVGNFKDIIGYDEQESKEMILQAKQHPERFTNLELVLLKTLDEIME